MVAAAPDEGLAERSNWERLEREHDLNGPPPTVAPPLPVAKPNHLNTTELTWEAVERLVVALARQIDAAHDVHRYGRSGQGQHGIDVAAFFENSPPAVYQSKDLAMFTAGDLEKAVTKYAEGKRPFGATRFIVVTTADASDTRIIEKLHELKAKYQSLTIELWDRDQISEKLRARPDMVARFFGEATADAFCVGRRRGESGAIPGPDAVSPDAVLRGPIAHLGLQQVLRDAEAAMDDQPATAAQRYGEIASALEASAFAPHAIEMRSRQAKALRSAGLADAAFDVDLQLALDALLDGSPIEALEYVGRIARAKPDEDEVRTPVLALISALASHLHHHDVSLDAAADAFDTLSAEGPYQLPAAAVFSEYCVADGRLGLLNSRRARLLEIAATAPVDDASLLLVGRLRASVADATGEWASLAFSVRTDYPPGVAAMLLARYGRYLAGHGSAPAAVESYFDAIGRASQVRNYGDAADWLFAVRAARILNGELVLGDRDGYRTAQALRSAGAESILPTAFSARSQALARVLGGNPADALEALRKYRWRSVTLGSLSEEAEAHRLIGDLFSRTGHAERAIQSWIEAGAVKQLKEFAASLQPGALQYPVPPDLAPRAALVRQSAFAFAAAAADRLTDADAASWAAAALDELVREEIGEGGGSFGASLAAFDVLGQLADATTLEGAQQLLGITTDLIERDPGHHRQVDEAMMSAIAAIAMRHEALRPAAVKQLCRAVCTGEAVAELAVERGQAAMRLEADLTRRSCVDEAERGNVAAAIALALVEPSHPAVLAAAEQKLKAVLAVATHSGGARSLMAGWNQETFLVARLASEARTCFAEKMAAILLDRGDVLHNRELALRSLRGIGSALDDSTRDRMFVHAMSAARGELDEGASLGFGPTTPLDRFRMDLDSGTLRYAGMAAAGVLSRTADQHREVVAQGLSMLAEADEQGQNQISFALSLVPVSCLASDLLSLAANQSQWVRALAAFLWCKLDGQPPDLGRRLATDRSEHVRLALAKNLPAGEEFSELRSALREDWHRRVRNLAADSEE